MNGALEPLQSLLRNLGKKKSVIDLWRENIWLDWKSIRSMISSRPRIIPKSLEETSYLRRLKLEKSTMQEEWLRDINLIILIPGDSINLYCYFHWERRDKYCYSQKDIRYSTSSPRSRVNIDGCHKKIPPWTLVRPAKKMKRQRFNWNNARRLNPLWETVIENKISGFYLLYKSKKESQDLLEFDCNFIPYRESKITIKITRILLIIIIPPFRSNLNPDRKILNKTLLKGTLSF